MFKTRDWRRAKSRLGKLLRPIVRTRHFCCTFPSHRKIFRHHRFCYYLLLLYLSPQKIFRLLFLIIGKYLKNKKRYYYGSFATSIEMPISVPNFAYRVDDPYVFTNSISTSFTADFTSSGDAGLLGVRCCGCDGL